MGSPQNVSETHYNELGHAGKLALFDKPKTVRIKNGSFSGKLELPVQSISLLVLKWKNPNSD